MEGAKEFFENSQEAEHPSTYHQGNYIERLLSTSIIHEKKEREIYHHLYKHLYTEDEAKEIIEYLQNNQIDPITSGNNYQMEDIQYKLNSLKEK